MEEEKKIVLTDAEKELLQRIVKREFDADNAPVEEQDLEISLIDRAAALEDTDEALVDERCAYTRDSNLLIWYWYRYQLQEGLCEPWNGITTEL